MSLELQPLEVKDCYLDYHHARTKAMLLTSCRLSKLADPASRPLRGPLFPPSKAETESTVWRATYTISDADHRVTPIRRYTNHSLSSYTAAYSSMTHCEGWWRDALVPLLSRIPIYTFQHRLHDQFHCHLVQERGTSIFDPMVSALILGLTT